MKRSLTALLAFVMALCASFALCVPAWAGDNGINPMDSDHLSLTVTGLEVGTNNEVYQGKNYSLGIAFKLESNTAGLSLHEGDSISVETNLGELFDVPSDTDIAVKDADGGVLATAVFAADKVTFTVGAAGSGQQAIEVPADQLVTTLSQLKANDVGATGEAPVTEGLAVGNMTIPVKFSVEIISSNPNSADTVDMDTFWKNAWSIENNAGAEVDMEVNPIGSMDLYGSTTYPKEGGRVPKIHDTLFISDTIPEQGFVDTDSVKIYAAVPTLAVMNEDYVDKYHGNYDVPAGTYYAKRGGTMRAPIDNRMTRLMQNDGETLEEFESRVKGQSLSWGVYRAEDKTETFMANFGRIGDAKRNNGIFYKDLSYGGGDRYVEDYPSIFGDEGITGGNVVSYFITFNTYYPDIVGQETLKNYAGWTSYINDGPSLSSGGNWSGEYIINNGGGTGVVRKNELALKLVDEETGEPIPGAEFKVQQLNAEGKWVDSVYLNDVMDENGRITFSPFPAGTYRIVQTSWADGYVEGLTVFGASGNASVGNVNENGEFTVTGLSLIHI